MTVLDRPAGVDLRIKLRRPATVAIFSAITFGIYSVLWYYKINREMRDFGASRGDPELAASHPWRSLTAITLGSLIVIPELVSLLRTVGRVQSIERLATGQTRTTIGLTLGVLGAVLLPLAGSVHRFGPLFSLAGLAALVTVSCLIQARLNAVWRTTSAITRRPLAAAEPRPHDHA